MIIDIALHVSLLRDGRQLDAFVAQTGEGAIELAVEMLRRTKCLEAGDTIIVQRLSDIVRRNRSMPASANVGGA